MKLQAIVLKRNSMSFAAALLGALASLIAGPNAALGTPEDCQRQRLDWL
jgi:hypothetical protein